MNKKIITIAEIVFALVFIIILSVFMITINNKGGEASGNLNDTLAMVADTRLEKYDGTTLSGSEVVSAVKGYRSLGGSAKLALGVKTLQQTGGTWYGYGSTGSEKPSYKAKNMDPGYINPDAQFEAKLLKNTNNVIVGISFIQNGGTLSHFTASNIPS